MDGIWPVLSGALAQERRMEVIANNLSNINTVGFKKEFAVFEGVSPIAPEVLGKRPVVPTPTFAVLSQVKVNFSPGEIRETGEPLDLAIDGEGFFPVRTQEGIRYTRSGSFTLNEERQVVTKNGYPLLAGVDPIVLPHGIIRVDAEGNVSVFPIEASRAPNEPGSAAIARGTSIIEVAKVALIRFKDLGHLKKVGDNLYEAVEVIPEEMLPEGVAAQEPLSQMQSTLDTAQGGLPFAVGRIRQGALEVSNVNPVEEMVSMIGVHRMYEAAQNAIRTADEVAGRAANDVGRIE